MSGIKLEPLEYRVVVLPDGIEETVGTGIIVKAEFTKTQDRRMQTKGLIVAVSDVAFKHWDGRRPKVGERIEFSMYAGQWYTEGETEYKIVNDADIVGILQE